MRKNLIKLSIMVIVLFPSCSKDARYNNIEINNYEYLSDDIDVNNEEEQVNIFIDNHLIEFNGIEYSINKSFEEVEEFGISKEGYDAMTKQILSNNIFLKDIIDDISKNSTNTILVDDCTYDKTDNLVAVELNIPIIKTLSENGNIPSGSISTSGQEESGDSFFAPSSISSVDCNCFANVAPAAVHIVKTYSFGVTKVSSRVSNGNVNVSLAASNITCSISYQTSDSNGGKCSWVGK